MSEADVLTQYEKRCVQRVFEAAGLMDDAAPVKMVDVAFDARRTQRSTGSQVRILSIDPGNVVLAWGLWLTPITFQGKAYLGACGMSQRDKKRRLDDLAMYHVDNVLMGCAGVDKVDECWIEQLQLNKNRDGTLSKALATGNDLLELQAVAAFVAGRLGARIRYVTTTVWGGGLGETVTKNRVRATLTPEELAIVDRALTGLKTKDHNLYDALGIGMHATRRYRVR